MKPGPEYDFPLHVRPERFEYMYDDGDSVSHWYTGIYTATLNFTIEIAFVPRVNRKYTAWPPVLPDSADTVVSQQEARIVSLLLYHYSITPDALRAGQYEILPDPIREKLIKQGELEELENYSGDVPRVIFYITPDEWRLARRELYTVSCKYPNWRDDTPRVSQLMDLSFARLILDRIIPSGYLTNYELKLIDRLPPQAASVQGDT